MTAATHTPTHRPRQAATPRALSTDHIVLAHGGGGQLSDELLRESILPRLGNPILNRLSDSGVLDPVWQNRPAMTIDSYVVQPWRFPGGDIGRIAVCGTVNDLAVCGAEPEGLALSLILAEGFAKSELHEVLDSIAATASEAGVSAITGDTKVVGRDQADGIYITTAGFGTVPFGRRLSLDRVRPGDLLIINGPIGEHGLAVMLARELPEVESVLKSDAAPLNRMIHSLLRHIGDDVVFMRDPTRGGLAGAAADLAMHSGYHVVLEEARIPLRVEARHAADMLGLDPLEIANEGKVLIVVRPNAAVEALSHWRRELLGSQPQIIGRIEDQRDGLCELITSIGGRRIIQKPYGEQLPRIC